MEICDFAKYYAIICKNISCAIFWRLFWMHKHVLRSNIDTKRYRGVELKLGKGVNFYDTLANLGINEIKYYEVTDNYKKHYGYFIIP